jgi:hypothetical protein
MLFHCAWIDYGKPDPDLREFFWLKHELSRPQRFGQRVSPVLMESGL